MSTNISKKRRDELTQNLEEIRNYIEKAAQDEKTARMLANITEVEKELGKKRYGVLFEEHRTEFDEMLADSAPVPVCCPELAINSGGEINLLIEGDNHASLKILEKTHKNKVDLIYIDPPYNTGASNWMYDNDYIDERDEFRHSKWLSMMKPRLECAKKLLTKDGVLICAIDENESATLRLLLEEIFGSGYEYDCITIVHNPRGIQGKNFSYNNEFAYFVIPKGERIIGERKLSESEIYRSPLRNWGGESLRSDARNCFYPIYVRDDEIVGFGDVSPEDFHPSKNEKMPDGTVAVYPIDAGGVERKWRYARQTVEEILQFLSVKKVRGVYDIEVAKTFGNYKTVWIDPKYDANGYGKKILKSLLPDCGFDFPKSLMNVYDCIYAVAAKKKNAVILDFFAGSGTTGHAVMKLNAEDGGNRRFILCTNNENNICRGVTYERIKRAIEKEGYSASLKYYKVDFIPVEGRMYYEYADEILRHTSEMIWLENYADNYKADEYAIILTEEDMAEFIADKNAIERCRRIYLGYDLLPDGEWEEELSARGIGIKIIPDCYYRELMSE